LNPGSNRFDYFQPNPNQDVDLGNFADPNATQPLLGSAVDSSHIAINNPALQGAALFPIGYPSIGAQPCTNCGHCDDGMNTINTFTNFSQPIAYLNNIGFGLLVDSAYQFNDGSLLDENSILDQAILMQYRNNDILSWNEVPMPYDNYNILPPNEIAPPSFGYGQGHQDEFMSLQNRAIDDNFRQFDNTANMMAFPAAANVPTGPVAAISGPPAPIQSAPHQRVPCTLCPGTFGRTSDLTRHITSVHHVGPRVLHLCTVLGCPKSFGTGYSRQDKLKEHLKKAHRL
jgi:hypothetical protein